MKIDSAINIVNRVKRRHPEFKSTAIIMEDNSAKVVFEEFDTNPRQIINWFWLAGGDVYLTGHDPDKGIWWAYFTEAA